MAEEATEDTAEVSVDTVAVVAAVTELPKQTLPAQGNTSITTTENRL